jgi:hypothetical protein
MKKLGRWLLPGIATFALLGVGPLTGNASNGSPPAWANNPRIDGAGDLVVRQVEGSLMGGSSAGLSGSSCQAEASTTGNVQVNCLAEDGTSPQNTESETSVSAFGSKVVVGFNDSLVCCRPGLNLSGYSVSTDGGKTFRDQGDLPFASNVQPIGDPTVAHDASGNFYFASLALSSTGIGSNSLISFYKMPAGSNQFQLVSVPVNVGDERRFFADKEYLAVGPDGHFFITWTFFSATPASPIMLSDSSDGVHWRTTQVSTAQACAQSSNPVPAGGTLYVSWEQSVPAGCTDATVTAAREMMATVDVASGLVEGITSIAPINGSGDTIVSCNNPSDLREVIQTATGHDARNFEMPTTTIDANGVLYAAWNDRPAGDGGDNSNATRIFLSFSRDGNHTWSAPQMISGGLDTQTMNDRFQPWITVDSSGVHAMWYERIAASPQDLIRTDKADLSLATSRRAPAVVNAESQLSTVAFPIVQTNPNQDPIISNCYMGDYNNIGSNGSARFVTWGDNRNVAMTSSGSENQPDVFLQSY